MDVGCWTAWNVGIHYQRYSGVGVRMERYEASSMDRRYQSVFTKASIRRLLTLISQNSWSLDGIYLLWVYCSAEVGIQTNIVSAMLILYTVAPLLYRMASSAYFNLSLLSSDFYGLLFGK